MLFNEEIKNKYTYNGKEYTFALRYKRSDLKKLKYAYLEFMNQQKESSNNLDNARFKFDSQSYIDRFHDLSKFLFELLIQEKARFFDIRRKIIFLFWDRPNNIGIPSKFTLNRIFIFLNHSYFIKIMNYFNLYNKMSDEEASNFLHEIDHIIDINNKIGRFHPKLINLIFSEKFFGIRYSLIIWILQMNRLEAYPEFLTDKSKDFISINFTVLEHITDLRKHLINFVKIEDVDIEKMLDMASQIYQFETLHLCGNYMAKIILLSNLYIEKKGRIIFKTKKGMIHNEEEFIIEAKDLRNKINEVFEKVWPNGDLKFSNINRDIYKYTAEQISNSGPMKFIKLYDEANYNLNIKKRYIILSDNFVTHIIKKAKKKDKKELE